MVRAAWPEAAGSDTVSDREPTANGPWAAGAVVEDGDGAVVELLVATVVGDEVGLVVVSTITTTAAATTTIRTATTTTRRLRITARLRATVRLRSLVGATGRSLATGRVRPEVGAGAIVDLALSTGHRGGPLPRLARLVRSARPAGPTGPGNAWLLPLPSVRQ